MFELHVWEEVSRSCRQGLSQLYIILQFDQESIDLTRQRWNFDISHGATH